MLPVLFVIYFKDSGKVAGMEILEEKNCKTITVETFIFQHWECILALWVYVLCIRCAVIYAFHAHLTSIHAHYGARCAINVCGILYSTCTLYIVAVNICTNINYFLHSNDHGLYQELLVTKFPQLLFKHNGFFIRLSKHLANRYRFKWILIILDRTL